MIFYNKNIIILINFSIIKMKTMKSLLLLCCLFNMINLYKLEDDEYYIQLSPHADKAQSNLFHFYNLKSVFYTWNSTEGDTILKINEIVKNDEIAIKRLSSVISVGDFVIKTCFNPNKIVEIIDEQNEILTPTDNYFKEVKNNLENIEYCYSTPISNPYSSSEYVVVTYWTENIQVDGKTEYKHKSILFYPKTKKFSQIYQLDTNGESFYAQSCTNLRNKYIYCNIDNSFSKSRNYHFSVIPSFIDANQIQMLIRLVYVYATFSETNYYRPIGIYRYLYTKNGKYANYFLTEMHDKQNNKTKLMTSYYFNWDLQSFINKNVDKETYNGINIEDIYIDPNLFNYILPNNHEELLIIYIMKGAEGKNILLLNRYNYTNDLRTTTKFDKYSSSNYLRDDICERPKYMQSMYINSFIKYDERDKEYMRNHPNQTFYTYQRDIATVLSCDDGNDKAFYEAKKIQMPQCLNTLNEINGISSPFIFTKDKNKVIIDLLENPNYKSLRNAKIQFFESDFYTNYIVVQPIKGGDRTIILNSDIYDLSGHERLEFIKSPIYREGKTIKLPYRIIQTEERDNSISCHLPSDICYLEFYYEGENIKKCPYCLWEGEVTCEICENIIGLKKIDNECGCECDENKGFKKEPQGNQCICKDGYYLSGDISKCLPLETDEYDEKCLEEIEGPPLNYIHHDLTDGRSICYENGLPMCCKCQKQIWFKLGEHILYSSRIGKCVVITFNNKIEMYSNKLDCQYNKTYEYKKCLGIDIKNEEEYFTYLNQAYEYKEEDNNSSLNITINNSTEKTINFYLLNNFTENRSSITLSDKCKEKIKKEKKLQNLLILIATIKKERSISTQVEYSFYNSTPESIDQNLNVSNICSKPNNTNNNFNIRKLEVAQEWTNNGNYTTEIDEVIINVEIDWTSRYKKNIHYLREKNINIFDSDDPFYNDVCFNFTTENDSDIYIQERREYYFIKDGLCEFGCKQVGFDDKKDRIICKCNIKGSTEGYENVTFTPNKDFDDFYIAPNIRVLKCMGKIKFSLGFLISLILLIAFIIISCKNCNMCFCCGKKSFFIHKEENRMYYDWEEPIEKLKKQIQDFEDEFKKEKNINIDNGDEDGGNQRADNQPDDPEVELFRRPLDKNTNNNIDDRPKPQHQRNIHNGEKNKELIDKSESSSMNINNNTITNPTDISEKKSGTSSENIKEKIGDIIKIEVEKKKIEKEIELKHEEEEKEEEEEEEKEKKEEKKEEGKEEEEEEEKEDKKEDKKEIEEEKRKKEEEEKEFERMFEGYSDNS